MKLNLRNFLSYRENVPTLDFTGVHVACLCGDNGHGKSALLDAITWCLWGHARGQVQDDLVSYGADEARVELDFLARDGRFKVIRSRRRGGGRRRQGASDLQLVSVMDDGEPAQVVSGSSIRETQAKVEQLVGMDYDTFINSAFLLQGRADEFTSKSPAERKAVLSSILGLEAYDRYQARAREKAAEVRSESDRLTGRVRQIQSDREALGEPGEELLATSSQVEEMSLLLAEMRTEAAELQAKVAALRALNAGLSENRTRLAEMGEEKSRLETYIKAAAERIKEHEKVLARAGEIEAGAAMLAAARERFARLEGARQSHDALNREQNELTRAVEIERARMETEVSQLRRHIREELSPLADSEAALEESLRKNRAALAGLSDIAANLVKTRQRVQLLATGIGEAQTLATRYQSEGEQIKEKLRLLEQADSHGVVCPLCQSPLSEDGCLRLAQNYEAEIEEKRDLYRANRNNLRTLETEKSELETELAIRESGNSAAANKLQAEIARAESHLEAARAAAIEMKQSQGRLDGLTAILNEHSYARGGQARLKAIERELQALGFDDEAFSQAVQQTRKLEPFVQLKARLETARVQLPEEEQVQNQNIEREARLAGEVSGFRRQIAEAEESVTQLPAEEDRLAQLNRKVGELGASLQSALARKALLEDRVERLANLEKELAESQESLKQAQEGQGIYQELAGAFGRQGIQAMLIETAVPRLEEEANVLLGRMTDNRMHVKLETQRERRSGSGEPIETLEINVSDELGARNYEMYSGGEAFRVNLALRIALSRVLSQRTGAPLPTLFIDEGFGSQDVSGRERILDVISAIEDDFDKIIVITHLDDLKDMFPVRIEVQKDENGSTFWLS
ncbi:MAG: SMC family ATPase [Chloroflexota bacterium]|nr:SMC family ATPase [Chloroflexota bacterium]